jgi:GR25 family glycosyltransferase involved in LPS biosynthesis
MFLEGDSDFLVVLEDDATPTSFLDQKILSILLELIDTKLHSYLYVDLCHEFDVNEIVRNYNLNVDYQNRNVTKSTFFANTTACYLMSRRTAEYLYSQFLVQPQIRLNSIDWVFTYLIRKFPGTEEMEYFIFNQPLYTNESLRKS